MRKRIPIYSLILAGIVFYSGCTKTATKEDKSPSSNILATREKKINAAKMLFEQNITSLFIQKFTKIPLWDKARVLPGKTGDRIIVPLDYDKKYTFKTNISGENRLLLKDQSYMTLYRDIQGIFHAEIETMYPDNNYLSGNSKGFSGYICLSTWDDKVFNKKHFVNGELVTNRPTGNQSIQTKFSTKNNSIDNESACSLWADYYNCGYGWQTYADCDYMFSVCMDDIGGGNNNSNNPNDTFYTYYTKLWVVKVVDNLGIYKKNSFKLFADEWIDWVYDGPISKSITNPANATLKQLYWAWSPGVSNQVLTICGFKLTYPEDPDGTEHEGSKTWGPSNIKY